MKKKSKIIAVAVALVIVIGAIAGVAYRESSSVKKILPKQLISVSEAELNDGAVINLIAHRGLSGIAPENTLAAFKKACEAGFYGVEFDIQLSSDNEWVVSHDYSMERMTGQKVEISQTTLFHLKELVFNNGANIEEYSGINIPTLRETLELLSQYDVVPVIEIKTKTKDQIVEFIKMLKEFGYLDKAWVISFNEEPLKEVKRMYKKMNVAYLTSNVKNKVIDLCLENGFDAISFNADKNGKGKARQVIDAGLIAQVWTVDNINTVEKFSDCGIEYFTTNSIIPGEVTEG